MTTRNWATVLKLHVMTRGPALTWPVETRGAGEEVERRLPVHELEERRGERPVSRKWIVLTVCMALAIVGARAGAQPAGRISTEARSAAEAATRAYRDAWLSNRPAAVMATLAPDAVLMPSGIEPISGEAAIRAFWFPPDGPETTVTAMEQIVDGIEGSGNIAVVRGHGSLTFSMRKDGMDFVRGQRSTFLNVVRRQEDGSWRIAIRTWSDLP